MDRDARACNGGVRRCKHGKASHSSTLVPCLFRLQSNFPINQLQFALEPSSTILSEKDYLYIALYARGGVPTMPGKEDL
jgi:hypothetical protein